MSDMTPSQPVEDTSLGEMHALTLTKQQWIVIFNVLVRTQYNLGDAALVTPIVNQIQPIVAALSDKDVKPVDGVVLDKKA